MPDDGEIRLLSLLPIIGGRSAKLRSVRKGPLISDAFAVGVGGREGDAGSARAALIRTAHAKKACANADAVPVAVLFPATMPHTSRFSTGPAAEVARR